MSESKWITGYGAACDAFVSTLAVCGLTHDDDAIGAVAFAAARMLPALASLWAMTPLTVVPDSPSGVDSTPDHFAEQFD